MNPSEDCFKIIKAFEGCKLKAYNDPGSGGLPITIGWGSTMRKDGSRFKLGDYITQEQADELLEWTVNNRAVILNSIVSKCDLTQNQFDALLSFIYNVGVSAFEKSTLFKFVKMNPNDPAILDEFRKWNRAGGKVLKGLVKRREAEAQLYSNISFS